MQRKYIIDLLTKTKMIDRKLVTTPMSLDPKLTLLSRQALDDPAENRIVLGTISHGIFIGLNSPLTLHAFSNADLAGDTDDFVSTNAYIIYLGSTPILWFSKKQKGVARSSTEAKYRVVANTASELRWVPHIFVPIPCFILE